MWEYVDDGFHIQFCLFIMLVVILSRLITVLVLCSICNCFFKDFQMPLSEQLGFTLGGSQSPPTAPITDLIFNVYLSCICVHSFTLNYLQSI